MAPFEFALSTLTGDELTKIAANEREAELRRWLGIATNRTRPYRPQPNGKAERMIQTLLRQWAYAVPYATSAARQAALAPWLRFNNEQRPHASLSHRPPISRLVSVAEQRS